MKVLNLDHLASKFFEKSCEDFSGLLERALVKAIARKKYRIEIRAK